jgi:hypothetical protein
VSANIVLKNPAVDHSTNFVKTLNAVIAKSATVMMLTTANKKNIVVAIQRPGFRQ